MTHVYLRKTEPRPTMPLLQILPCGSSVLKHHCRHSPHERATLQVVFIHVCQPGPSQGNGFLLVSSFLDVLFLSPSNPDLLYLKRSRARCLGRAGYTWSLKTDQLLTLLRGPAHYLLSLLVCPFIVSEQFFKFDCVSIRASWSASARFRTWRRTRKDGKRAERA